MLPRTDPTSPGPPRRIGFSNSSAPEAEGNAANIDRDVKRPVLQALLRFQDAKVSEIHRPSSGFRMTDVI